MFDSYFVHDTLRKYVIYFGTLFSGLYLPRGNSSPYTQVSRVPLNYGPHEKHLARMEGNPDLDRPIAIQLPRMSFEVMGIQYDPERKLSSTGVIKARDPSDANKVLVQNNPVPYNITFNLYIMVKNTVDGTRIVEQILPNFDPEFTASLKLNPDMGVNYDVPLILNQVDFTDTYENMFEVRRAIIWTLTFTLKGWFFGPIKSSGVIKQVELNFYVPPNGQSIEEVVGKIDPNIEVVIRPGLTSDGEPTTDPNQTIPKEDINFDDPWAFIEEVYENF